MPQHLTGFPGSLTGASVKEILFRKVSLADFLPKPETAILTVSPSRPSSSTTLCWTKDVWEPGSKKHLATFLQPLDPQRTAGTVCRITFPPELTAMELATMEDDEGGVADEDGGSEDFELASSG